MGLFSSIAGIFGGKSAADKIDPMAFFTPSQNIFASYTGPGQYNLTQTGQQYQSGISDLFNRTLQEYQQFQGGGREEFGQRFFDAIDALQSRREGQAFSDYASRLFNAGGATTGSQRMLADYQTDIQDAQQRRAMQAELAAFQRQQALMEQIKNPFAMGMDFGAFQQQQQAPQQAYLQGVANKQMADAQASRGLFDAIGGILDMGAGFIGGGGLGSLGGLFGGDSGGGGFMASPSSIFPTANPISPQFRSTSWLG